MTPCAQDAKPAESGSPTTPLSLSPALEACLTPLIGALEKQTAAMDRLAASNQALAQAIVQAMAEETGDGDLPSAGQYLDGTPR